VARKNVRFTLVDEDEQVRIVLAGELDLKGAEQVARVWEDLARREDLQRVVLDLRGLAFIDSSGIAAVLRLNAECRRADRELAIVRPAPSVLHRFDATGATDHLPIVDPP
jgi:anti-anti-sigma factor